MGAMAMTDEELDEKRRRFTDEPHNRGAYFMDLAEVIREQRATLAITLAALTNAQEQRDACAQRAERAEAAVAILREALAELERTATTEANEKGGSGDHLARISDAREALAATADSTAWLAERDATLKTEAQRTGRDDARRAVIDMLDDVMFLAGEEAWKPVFAAIAARDAALKAKWDAEFRAAWDVEHAEDEDDAADDEPDADTAAHALKLQWLAKPPDWMVARELAAADTARVDERRSLNELTLAYIEGRAGYPSREIDLALAKRLADEREAANAHVAMLRETLEARGCDPDCDTMLNTSENMSGCNCATGDALKKAVRT